MTPAGLVVEKVRQNLRLGGSDAGLAMDYSRECANVNARLEQLREILDSGQELQALLMAEAPPSILDEASLLQSVAEEWKASCVVNGLESAPELQFQAAQRLNLLYTKGISPSHAIYKDFREAIMSRDDERAMEIARAIERLNPADSNAKAERERLEAKVFRTRDSELSESLVSEDARLILKSLANLEALGQSALEAASLNYTRGVEVRAALMRDSACRELQDIYLPSLKSAFESVDWRKAREDISRIEAICSEHGLVLNPEYLQSVSMTRGWVMQEFNSYQKKTRFQNALNELLTHINEIDTDYQDLGTLSLNQSQEALSVLKSLWQSVEGFSMEVVPEVVQKVTKSANTLEERIRKLQRRNLLLWAGGIGVFLILTGLGGWWFMGSYNASGLEKEIQIAISSHQPKALENLVSDAKSRNLQSFSPALLAAIAGAESYLAAERERMEALRKNLETLEEQEKSGFSGMEIVRLQEDWSTFQKTSESIAEENLALLRPKINAIQRAIKSKLSELSSDQFEVARKRVQAFDQSFGSSIRKSKTLDDLDKAIESAIKEVREWDSLLKSPESSVSVPADIQTRATEYDRQLSNQRAELDQAKKRLGSMAQAPTLNDFLSARAEFVKSLKSVPLEDINAARNASAISISEEKMLGGLLMPWDTTAWSLFAQGGDAANLRPNQMSEGELKIYGQIYNAVGKKPVYKYMIKGSKTTTGSKDRFVYAQGKIDSTSGGSRKGKVFDTAFPSTPNMVSYTDKVYREESSRPEEDFASIEELGVCPFSEMSIKMDLEKFIDAQGKPQLTAWEVIDRATSSPKIDPVFLAYIVQSMDKMTSGRPYAWGIHFTPSFSKIKQQIAEATTGASILSHDWITSEKLQQQLGELSIQSTRLETEAQFLKVLSEKCKAKGLQYAGYLGFDMQPVVLSSVLSNELWGLAGDAANPKPALLCVRDSSGNWKMHLKPLAFSPLFTFPEDRRLILDQAKKLARIQDWSHIQVPPFVEDLVNPRPSLNTPISPTAN